MLGSTGGNNHNKRVSQPLTHFTMDTYRGERRPLLLFAADVNDPAYRRQKDMLDTVAAARADRDMVLIEVVGPDQGSADGVSIAPHDAAALRTHFSAPQNAFTLVLVGKDGTEKLRGDEPVDPERIFDLIDSMPMRQDERSL